VATEYNLLKIIGDIEVCTDLKMPKVKVPNIFFGTQGFSAHRDRRYFSSFTLPKTRRLPDKLRLTSVGPNYLAAGRVQSHVTPTKSPLTASRQAGGDSV
jgi:hypothetical protein